MSGIHKDINQSWTLLSEISLENMTAMTYKRSINLSLYDDNDYVFTFSDNDSSIIQFRYAIGNGTTALDSKHAITSEVINIKFPEGEIVLTIPRWIKKLHIVHGILMWFAWGFCATLGIFCAKYRPFIQSTVATLQEKWESGALKPSCVRSRTLSPRVAPSGAVGPSSSGSDSDSDPLQGMRRERMQAAIGRLQPWFLLHRAFALLTVE